MLLLVPRLASALQLHWNDGTTALTFSEARRCTLLVQADSMEQRLPSEWRVLWVADSSTDIRAIPLDPQQACLEDFAQVSSVDEPATAADTAVHLRTAHFCSDEGAPVAETASFVIGLPAGSAGRLKAVALDPHDSTQVIESNEITFNGGVDGNYAPVILSTSTTHQSTDYLLTAVGSGLAAARSLTLAAPDGSWSQPLTITAVSDTSISASAPLAAHVPASVLQVSGMNGLLTTSDVAADPPPPTLTVADTGGCERRFEEVLDRDDPYMIQPKDFAFVEGGWTPAGSWIFHLFYIRRNQRSAARFGGDATEKTIGHQVSNDLVGWSFPRSQAQDTMAIRTRGGSFDSLHVWAPTVVLKGLTYYLLYTGVDKDHNQRIGLATSTDLVNWTQGDRVLQASSGRTGIGQVAWADSAPAGYSGQAQLRDPFVMPDPDVPGGWLMYFVTVPTIYSPEMVVGVAKSPGDLSIWASSFPLWNTHHSWINPVYNSAYAVESPHAFYRDGSWWLFSTVNNDSVWAVSNVNSPTDTVSLGSRWTPTQKLWTLVPPAQSGWFYYWHASEYLPIPGLNDIEYLAAYTDDIVGIAYTQMRPAASPYLFSMDCPSAAGVDPGTTKITHADLQLLGARPARSSAVLCVELPTRMRVHLAVYDILGRRVQTLADGELPPGRTDLSWNGRSATGGAVGSGLYFASLTTVEGRRSVRVVLVR